LSPFGVFEQPYIAPTPTSNWRPAPTDPQAFTPGSKFQFSDPSTPAEAVRLVREQNLHFAFGDFDDHLEDVTIGELSFAFNGGVFFVRSVVVHELFYLF
jgi:hypothetical protein